MEPLLRAAINLFAHGQPLVTENGPLSVTRQELVLPESHVRCVSPVMVALYQDLRAVSWSSLPILILGETGVGKEGIAKTVHLSSSRAGGPFVALNCASIPSDLLEAELFGIGRGVATGVVERAGKIEKAQGGTLFLDEIGDMPLSLQSKLLRVLQERVVHPLGRPAVFLDVRFIAATNSDPEARISDGSFRRDLYYRLAGFVLTVPSLRERPEDIPLLIEHFLRIYSKEAGRNLRGLTVAALESLKRRTWRGNVRELEHEIRRLIHTTPVNQLIDSSRVKGAVAVSLSAATAKDPTEVPTSPRSPVDEEASPGPWERLEPSLDLAEVEKKVVLAAAPGATRLMPHVCWGFSGCSAPSSRPTRLRLRAPS